MDHSSLPALLGMKRRGTVIIWIPSCSPNVGLPIWASGAAMETVLVAAWPCLSSSGTLALVRAISIQFLVATDVLRKVTVPVETRPVISVVSTPIRSCLTTWLPKSNWKLLAAAITLGGNVRAGVEDNLYLPDGTMCKSNGELIGKARQMVEDAGRKVATIAEAREMLGLKAA